MTHVNLFVKQKQTQRHRHSRLVVAKGEGGRAGEGGMDWEFEVSIFELLHIGWISNKVLLYGTQNYIQYSVINHNGKEYEKNVYVYVCLYICICT